MMLDDILSLKKKNKLKVCGFTILYDICMKYLKVWTYTSTFLDII